MSTLRRLISNWSGALVVSGAEREAAVMLSYPHTQTADQATVEKIDQQLAEALDSFTDATPAERNRIHERLDDLLEQRYEITGTA
jgi:acyl-CoA reductase-like NAD-dependent aldehyde dehydrogenase